VIDPSKAGVGLPDSQSLALTQRHLLLEDTAEGPPTTNSAYQGELLEILGIQTLTSLPCVHYSIRKGGVTLACDGLSALQQAFYEGP
jgi:hypothetical protein